VAAEKLASSIHRSELLNHLKGCYIVDIIFCGFHQPKEQSQIKQADQVSKTSLQRLQVFPVDAVGLHRSNFWGA